MKKIISFVIMISIFMTIVPVYAADSNLLEIELEQTTITVSGQDESCVEMPVTIALYSDDMSVYLPKQAMGNSDGTYSFRFSTTDLKKGNTYNIAAGGTVSASTTMYYPTDEELADSISAFNNGQASNVEQLIENNNRYLNLNLTKYNQLDDKSVIGEYIVGKNFSTRDDLNEAFKNAVNLALNNQFAYDIYVSSKNGNDAGEGTLDKPYKTIEKAKEKVRDILSQNSENGIINVNIEDGIYQISQPITFSEEDSSENITVTYRGYGENQPVITGTEEITNWKYYDDGIYYADYDKEINNLFESGKTVIKARYPNAVDDEAQFLEAVQPESGASKTQFTYSDEYISNISNISDLEVYIWAGNTSGTIMWFSNIEDVTSVANNTITLAHETRYVIGTGSKYYMQGALEFLDKAGEYYYDSTAKKLYYKPIGDISKVKITAAVTSHCIEIKGNNDAVENLVFENLEICGTDRTDAYDESVNYITSTGAAIVMENTKNITIRNCRIHDVGGDGITMLNSNQNNTVYGNKIYNVGRNGIQTIGNDQTKPVNNCLISNNEVTNGGLFVGHGNGVYLGSKYGTNNVVSHNVISYFKRIGVLVGENYGGVNRVEYNDISHMNTESEDSGLIYAVNQYDGASTIVKNNYLHDSTMYFGGGNGIYFDNNAHNCVAENNIITNLGEGGEGYVAAAISCKGDNTIVRNNYILNNTLTMAAILSYAQGNTAENLTIEKNIISQSGDTMYRFINWTDDRIKSADYNLFYNSDNTYNFQRVSDIYKISVWNGLGYDNNSKCADPVMNDNFVISEQSPALKLGINQIDINEIGLKNDFIFELGINEESTDSYITSVVLLDEEKNVLNSLSKNCKYVNIGVSSPSETEENVTVFVAEYDGKKLSDVDVFKDITVTMDDCETKTSSINVPENTQGYLAKIMVWDGINKMNPKCYPIEIK